MTGGISITSGLEAVGPPFDGSAITGTIAIANGGTGATTAAAALTALGAGGGSTILTPTISGATITNGTTSGVVQGGVIFLTRQFTGTGTVTCSGNDYRVVINKTVTGATTVVLVASPATGRTIVIKDGKGDANANNISVAAASGTIDGTTTSTINTNYGAKTYAYNGTEWGVE